MDSIDTALGFLNTLDEYSTITSSKDNTTSNQESSTYEVRKYNLCGLNNQGATCYLNSVIQVLYMNIKFRNMIYSLTKEELNAYEEEQKNKDSKNKDSDEKKLPDSITEDIINNIIELYGFDRKNIIKALIKYPLDSQYEIAINYLIEGCISDDEPINTDMKPKLKPRKIPIELAKLFARLQLYNGDTVSTTQLTDSFGWNNNESFQQQDVFELTCQLLDAIERSLGPKGDLLNIFKGILTNNILCKECKNISSRQESFMGLPITVQNCKTLHEGLASMCSLESFEGKNQYFCSKCSKKTNAAKSTTFNSLPSVFIINLNRYTWTDQGERAKLSHKCSFPTKLDMEPYLESSLPIEDMVFGNLKPQCPEYSILNNLSSLCVNDSNKNYKKKTKNSKSSKEIYLESPLFNENSPYLYELCAIIIHSGTAYGGHYTAYIDDLLKSGIHSLENTEEGLPHWFHFNDRIIEPIPFTQIATQYGGSGQSTSAYMLLYRKIEPITVIETPAYLIDRLREENLIFQNERVRYENFINTISISIYTENEVEVFDNIIRLIKDPLVIDFDRRENFCDLLELFNFSQLCWSKLDTKDKFASIYKINNCSESVHSLKELCLFDKDILLLWNGLSIGVNALKVVDKPGNELVLSCFYFSPSLDSTSGYSKLEFVFKFIKDETNLIDFITFLMLKTAISEFESLLFYINKGYDILPYEFDSTKLLLSEIFTSSCTLFIEAISEPPQNFCRKDYDLTKSNIRLFVVSSCDSELIEGPSCDFGRGREVSIKTSNTIAELKQIAINSLSYDCKYNHTNKGYRLRRIGGLNKLGSLFNDESITLKASGLEENDVFILLEHGNLLPVDCIEVNVSIKLDVRKEFAHIINFKSTIKEVKTKLLEVAGIDGTSNEFCLYQTDITWDERGKLFANENLSLEKLGFSNGDCLWLEEGVIPSKGLINLDFFQYIPHKTSTFKYVYSKIHDDVSFKIESNTEENHESNDSGIKKIFSLQMQQNDTLAELKNTLHSQGQIAVLTSSSDNIRIRGFKGHIAGKLFGFNDQTLKKLGIVSDRSLIFQIMNTPEPSYSISTMILQVFMCNLLIKDEVKWSPFPIEVIWDPLSIVFILYFYFIYNKGGSFDSLYDTLANSTSIPKKYICLAKWMYSEKRWAIISKHHEKLEWDYHILESKKRRIGKSRNVNNKDNKKMAMSDEDLAILLSSTSFESTIDTSSLTISDTPSKKSLNKKKPIKSEKATEEIQVVFNNPLHSKPYLLKDADVILAIDIRELYAVLNPEEPDILKVITSDMIPPLPFSNKTNDNSLDQALFDSLNEFKSNVKNVPEMGIHISVDV